jgi:multidrug efflux pump subunit AcrB
MRALPSLSDVRDAYAETQPIVEVTLRRDRMAERGIVPEQVASALSGALGGVNASDLRETDKRTPITALRRPAQRATWRRLRRFAACRWGIR